MYKQLTLTPVKSAGLQETTCKEKGWEWLTEHKDTRFTPNEQNKETNKQTVLPRSLEQTSGSNLDV